MSAAAAPASLRRRRARALPLLLEEAPPPPEAALARRSSPAAAAVRAVPRISKGRRIREARKPEVPRGGGGGGLRAGAGALAAPAAIPPPPAAAAAPRRGEVLARMPPLPPPSCSVGGFIVSPRRVHVREKEEREREGVERKGIVSAKKRKNVEFDQSLSHLAPSSARQLRPLPPPRGRSGLCRAGSGQPRRGGPRRRRRRQRKMKEGQPFHRLQKTVATFAFSLFPSRNQRAGTESGEEPRSQKNEEQQEGRRSQRFSPFFSCSLVVD